MSNSTIPLLKSSEILEKMLVSAKELALEESNSSYDAIFNAADEVANENGLSSPFRESIQKIQTHPQKNILIDNNQKIGVGIADVNINSPFNLKEKKLSVEKKLESIDNSSSSNNNNTKSVEKQQPALLSKDAITAILTESAVEVITKQPSLLPFLKPDLITDDDNVDDLLEKRRSYVLEGKKKNDNTNIKSRNNNNKSVHISLDESNQKELKAKDKARYLQRVEKNKNDNKESENDNYPRGRSNRSNNTNLLSESCKLSNILSKSTTEDIQTSYSVTATQEILFRSMKLAKSKSAGAKSVPSKKSTKPQNGLSKTLNNMETYRATLDKLSRPNIEVYTEEDLKKDPTLKYALLDDAKECTFHPKIKKDKNANPDEAKSNFIDRQEGAERSRLAELEMNIGKENYDAIVDKRFCPNCKAKQSYDDIKEKRKKCNNCQIEYKRSITWGAISKDFFERGTNYTKEMEESKKKILLEMEQEYLNSLTREAYDRKTGKIVKMTSQDLNKVKWTNDLAEEFFERMQERENYREEKLYLKSNEVYDTMCTFKPKIIHKAEKKNDDDSDEEDDNSDDGNKKSSSLIEKFLQRVEEDIENKRKLFPQRFSAKKTHEHLSFKP